MTQIQHDCLIPHRRIPSDIAQLVEKWRCPDCRQKWRITYYSSGYTATRVGRPSIRWEIRKLREIRRESC